MPASDPIKNIPSLNDYYRRIHFGLAAGRMNLAAEQMADCVEQPNFSAVELPCDYFSALSAPAREKLRKRFQMVHSGNLFAKELTSMLPMADKNIQRDFIRACRVRMPELATAGIRCCVLDFSLIQVLGDEMLRKALSQILRQLHPILHDSGMTVLFPVHLPLPDPKIKEQVTSFLREQMIPGLKLRLEIYPHQLKPDFKPEDIAGTFRLETASVLFCCNADSGNRLLRVHLTPWLRYFALTGFPGPFLFCPFSQNNRLALVESEAFSKLTEEIVKNH